MFYLTKSETVMPHFNLEVVGNIAYKIKKKTKCVELLVFPERTEYLAPQGIVFV